MARDLHAKHLKLHRFMICARFFIPYWDARGVGLGVRVASVSVLAWRMKMMGGETMKRTATKDRIGDRSHPTYAIGTTMSETVFDCSFLMAT